MQKSAKNVQKFNIAFNLFLQKIIKKMQKNEKITKIFKKFQKKSKKSKKFRNFFHPKGELALFFIFHCTHFLKILKKSQKKPYRQARLF